MTFTIRTVDAHFVQQVWPMVKGFLQEALEKGDSEEDYNIHHVQSFLTSGQWLLIIAADEQNRIHGAMTISFVNYPLHRVAFVTATGGKEIITPQSLEQLKVIAKQRGATKIQAFGRDAMVRLLAKSGFHPRNTLVEVLT